MAAVKSEVVASRRHSLRDIQSERKTQAVTPKSGKNKAGKAQSKSTGKKAGCDAIQQSESEFTGTYVHVDVDGTTDS